jgi:hypothetical protein
MSTTTLPQTDRRAIKDKFKSFNDDFEEMYKQQKRYAVPDTDLRSQIIKDIKQLMVPMYTRFLERYVYHLTQVHCSMNECIFYCKW